MTGNITVECPDCGSTFETIDVGDVVVCEGCEEPFNRFVNVVDDSPESGKVECTVCSRDIGRGPEGFGIAQHAAMHRREFEDLTGREPEDYDEVREFFATEGRQPTLHEAALDEDQTQLLGGSR